MNTYFNKDFYPKNRILLYQNHDKQLKTAEKIVAEAVKLFPEEFNSDNRYFLHELRYIAPFKEFNELKRLQGVAADKARFKDEFRGYIILDVSQYIQHEEDAYFDISVKFLHDQNEFWKYIFLIDSQNYNSALALTRKILSILHCGVIDEKNNEFSSVKKLTDIKTFCKKKKVSCSNGVALFFERLINEKGYSKDLISIIINEIKNFKTNNKIDRADLRRYFEEQTPTIKYMLSNAEYSDICDVYKSISKKGADCSEKI